MNPLFCLFFVTTVLIAGCGNTSQNNTQKAIDYSERLINAQSAIISKAAEMNTAIGEADYELAETRRQECEGLADTAIAITKKIGPFNGNDNFQLAALKYFEATRKIYSNDWKEMLSLILHEYDNDSVYLKQLMINDIAVQIDKKNKKYETDLINAQRIFAEKNNFSLHENRIDTAPANEVEDLGTIEE